MSTIATRSRYGAGYSSLAEIQTSILDRGSHRSACDHRCARRAALLRDPKYGGAFKGQGALKGVAIALSKLDQLRKEAYKSSARTDHLKPESERQILTAKPNKKGSLAGALGGRF